MLSWFNRSIVPETRELLVPLCPAFIRPHLEYCIQLWTPQFKKDTDEVEYSQRRVTRMLKVTETMEDGASLFSEASEGRPQNKGPKLCERRFHWNVKNSILTVRAVWQWIFWSRCQIASCQGCFSCGFSASVGGWIQWSHKFLPALQIQLEIQSRTSHRVWLALLNPFGTILFTHWIDTLKGF